MLDRVPVGITLNVLPWKTILVSGHSKAFRNRCLLFKCAPMPSLEMCEGKLHPQAWLYIDEGYSKGSQHAPINTELLLAEEVQAEKEKSQSSESGSSSGDSLAEVSLECEEHTGEENPEPPIPIPTTRVRNFYESMHSVFDI